MSSPIEILNGEFLRLKDESRQVLTEVIKTNPELLKSLSFLLGWDYTTENWNKLITDTDGRLLVSTSPTKSNTNTSSNPTVTNVDSTVLIENPTRKQMTIQNVGLTDCYLGFGEAATITEGMLLESGATYIDDVFYGAVHAIVAAGSTDLTIQEFE